MSVLAADTALLSSVLFCTEGGQSTALAPLQTFGNFLMHEQALRTTPPVQYAPESPLPSPALTVLAPLLEVSPEAGKDDLSQDTPLEEEAPAWHSILQTVQTLLHSVQARMTLPGLALDVSPAFPASLPQESVSTPQAQRGSMPPRPETSSVYGHESLPQTADAAWLAVAGAAEELVRDGVASGMRNPTALQAAAVGTEDSVASRLALSAQPKVVLSRHAVGSTGQLPETGSPDGLHSMARPREEAHVLLENAPAVQTPMHFTGSGRAEGQSGVQAGTTAEARTAGLPQQTVPLIPESVAQSSEWSSPQHTLLLQLQPPELGAIRIRVRVAHAQLSASFWADSPAVRSLLQSHFPILHQNLSEQGLQVQHIAMALTTGDFTGYLGHPAQQHPAFQPHAYSQTQPVAGEQSGEAMVASPTRRRGARRGLVDVVI